MAKTLANYDPLVQIPSGMTPAGADFPIVESHDILVGENDKRLDAKLDDIDSAIGNVGETPIATQLSSKVNTSDIQTTVRDASSASDSKIPSEKAVRSAIDSKTINVDSTVTEGSTNAVSGGAVHTQLATKQDKLTFDTTPTASSSNPVTSGGVKTALDAKQDTLTFDTTPTASSSNPVTSGGVKAALDNKQNTLTYETTPIVGSVNPVTSTGIRNAIDAAAAGNLGEMQSQYDTFVNEAEDVLDRAASLSNGMVACDNIAAETTAGDTRILLYTGTTNSTYTNGHWYYNSAASDATPVWTDGGAVGSAPTIDNTLTTAGAAADSKSVGDAIENIVTISDTQPGSNSGNKVWIKETTDEEVQIPTYEEHISKSNKADIATNNESDNGSGTITASKAYAIGDHFYINNTNTSSENYGVSTLYKTTAAIASGDAIVVGTNCEASRVADEITSLSNDIDTVKTDLDAINEKELIELSSGYIDTHGSTVDASAIVTSETYSYGIKACISGDIFSISGSGGAAPRLWCFIDNSGTVLSNSLQNVNASELLLTAPENAAYCIINTKTPNVASYKSAPINMRVEAIESNFENVSGDLINTVSALTTKVDSITGRFYESGLTWDWWFTSSVTDEYGTTYIGFIDQNAKCGVMMRMSDGQTLYKYFDTARNADDHNPFGVAVDKNGYVYLFGTLGHSYKNYMTIYKADVPYTINCTWTKLASKIAQPTGVTYKTCYAQAFTYYDSTENKEYITNFFRCLTSNVGACYAAVQSIDGGVTWTLHGVVIVHDPYIKIFNKGNGVLGMACTYNTASTNRNIYLGEIDVKTGNMYANGTLVGTWSTIANGLDSGVPTQEIYASITVTAETDFVTYHTASDRFRLLDARYNHTSNATEILWALMDTGGMDYTYYLYNGVIDKALGKSGVPFYLYSGYLPGMCFIDEDLIGIARNVSGVQDGKHTFEVYSISDDEVKKRISYNNMCIRPLDCGNSLIALSIGVYNDTSDISTTGIFTAWKLSPVFISII